MTRAEYLIKRMDQQTTQAIKCYRECDIEGSVMHYNCAKGFKIKLEKLNEDQCREVIKCEL